MMEEVKAKVSETIGEEEEEVEVVVVEVVEVVMGADVELLETDSLETAQRVGEEGRGEVGPCEVAES